MRLKYYPRPHQKKGVMNRTEEAYSLHLELLKKAGQILDWRYEPETLKIGPDCRYTPDFRVISKDLNYPENSPIIEFHEVKGTTKGKPYIEDDALVKIKVASELHPYKFIIVWRGLGGRWMTREIN
jgi:hypothetical protein